MKGLRGVLAVGVAGGLSSLLVSCGESSSSAPPLDAPPISRLLVGNTRGNNVVQFDPTTGVYLGEWIAPETAGLFSPDTLLLGPDGNGDNIADLYIASGNLPGTTATLGASAVLRFDGETGAFIDTFVGDDPTTAVDETGGLIRPYGMAFGPDGLLYVSSFLSDEILRYDSLTGQFIDVFAVGNQQPGGLNGPNGLLFDSEDNLYVTTQGSVAVDGEADFSLGLPSQLLKFDIVTATSEVLASPDPSPESFGFVSLLGLAFGPDGLLYVSDFANDIRVYDSNTGVLIDTYSTNYTGTSPSSNFIGSLAFGSEGTLFVVGFDNEDDNNPIGTILRYDSATGSPFPSQGNGGAIFVPANAELVRPIGVLFY
ncbi:MAG: NHL repeat-containing protein [Cyanobacteriota bacterium]|nr:NHL repeat-containing protein [Cyanobacteriota bacterium]